MCTTCTVWEQRYDQLTDELVRWRMQYQPETYPPPGTISRTLRLTIMVNHITRRHLEALKFQTDPELQSLYALLASMTGLP